MEHLRAIHFDIKASLWTENDIDDLGNLLNKYAHRFSKHGTDLGHVTVNPLRIILKKDAQPVKQRPHRHSPVKSADENRQICSGENFKTTLFKAVEPIGCDRHI